MDGMSMAEQLSNDFIQALKTLSERLKDQNIPWVFDGSVSLALQGVNVKPGDIDIITDKTGVYKINELLKDYETKKVEFKEADTFKSYLGEFKINDVKIEVMGEFQEKAKRKWFNSKARLASPIIIQFDGMQLPVSPLLLQLRSYESALRPKDAAKVIAIKATLANRQGVDTREIKSFR